MDKRIRVLSVSITRIFDEDEVDSESPVETVDYLNDYHNKGNE